jgi:hypothetical protein
MRVTGMPRSRAVRNASISRSNESSTTIAHH